MILNAKNSYGTHSSSPGLRRLTCLEVGNAANGPAPFPETVFVGAISLEVSIRYGPRSLRSHQCTVGFGWTPPLSRWPAEHSECGDSSRKSPAFAAVQIPGVDPRHASAGRSGAQQLQPIRLPRAAVPSDAQYLEQTGNA